MIAEENRIAIETFRMNINRYMRRVAGGERFLITKHGKPLGLLTAPHDEAILDNVDKLNAEPLFVQKRAAR